MRIPSHLFFFFIYQDCLFRNEQRWKSIWFLVAFVRANRDNNAYKWSGLQLADEILFREWTPPYQPADPDMIPYGTCMCCDKFAVLPYSFVSNTPLSSALDVCSLGFEHLNAFSYTRYFASVT